MRGLPSVVIVHHQHGFVAHLRFQESIYDCDLSSTSQHMLQRMISEVIHEAIGNREYWRLMDAFNASWNRQHTANRPRIVT